MVDRVRFASVPNNSTLAVPRAGDLLIYAAVGPGMAPTGHVAAVVEVDAAHNAWIRIAEENWANAAWLQPGYARSLTIERAADGSYSVVDPPYSILGLKRVAQ